MILELVVYWRAYLELNCGSSGCGPSSLLPPLLVFTPKSTTGYSQPPNMCEADSILAGERSRNRPDRMVNAFAPGYVIAESAETDNTMCIMTFTNAPGELD
jgi:hypothetical protein